ncbi:branched-chain amino acid ABC transporter permease [Chachezhania sediminis]|uniref:branched-chain amino acid ABC transporter permease n=1 Tax=Chachezhania sediminis TaxID=2599291 RepID=UPI00131C565C|nr:branched-chain amino acid ABC transporter permease [Chachezhania sediminis]
MTDIAHTDHRNPGLTAPAYRPADAPRRRLLSGGNIVTLLVLALLISIPIYSKGFFVFQMTQMLVYAIAVLGLNLLTGINGQFSLGHSAFYAIGAYTCAILVELGGVNYMLTIPIAGIVAFGFGFLFAFPALRLEGLYLALATFALAVATPQLLKLHAIEQWTGGVQGIVMFQDTFDVPVPFGLDMDPGVWTFYLTLFVFAVVYVLAMALVKSRTGRAMMAIRDNPIAARSMGISLPYYKATAFGVSALVTGIAGALNAIVIKFVAPDSFTFFFAILILVGMVIGGVGWLQGCLIGGLAMLYLPNIAEIFDNVVLWFAGLFGFADLLPSGNALQQQFIRLSGVIYGVILVLFIYVAPSGAGGLIRAIVSRVKRLTS